MPDDVKHRWCGRVKLVDMKYHDVLQAHPSQQAYSRNLKAHAKIG